MQISELAEYLRISPPTSPVVEYLRARPGRGLAALELALNDAEGGQVLRIMDYCLRIGGVTRRLWRSFHDYLGEGAFVEASLRGMRQLDLHSFEADIDVARVLLVGPGLPEVPGRYDLMISSTEGLESLRQRWSNHTLVVCIEKSNGRLTAHGTRIWVRDGSEDRTLERLWVLRCHEPAQLLEGMGGDDSVVRWLAVVQSVMLGGKLGNPWQDWERSLTLSTAGTEAVRTEVMQALKGLMPRILWDPDEGVFRLRGS